MSAFLAFTSLLGRVNAAVLCLGRWIGVAAIAAMVLAILIQVVFRYVLNNALPWPDEAARFCMLWMTGLMAPTAFRRGGFVAIDMFGRALPLRLGHMLNVFLLCLCLLVLVVAVQIGWGEVTGFGGRFKTAALYVPLDGNFSTWYRVPRSWMMASLLVGAILLSAVNIELILRAIATSLGIEARLPVIEEAQAGGGE